MRSKHVTIFKLENQAMPNILKWVNVVSRVVDNISREVSSLNLESLDYMQRRRLLIHGSLQFIS